MKELKTTQFGALQLSIHQKGLQLLTKKRNERKIFMKRIVLVIMIITLFGLCFCGCGSSAKEGDEPGTAIVNNCYVKINPYFGKLGNTVDLVLVDVKFENNDDEAHSLCDPENGVCNIDVYHDGVKVQMDIIGGDCWKEILPGSSLNFTIRSSYSELQEKGQYLVVLSTMSGEKITEKQFTVN